MFQVHVGKHLHHHRDPAATGDVRQRLQVPGRRMVEDVAGAGPADHLHPRRGPGRADDHRASVGSELSCRDPDATARSVDQHGLARLEAGLLEQRAPGGHTGHPHGCALAVRQGGGQRMDHRRVHHGQVRVQAGAAGRSQRRHEDPVPRRHLVHSGTDRIDHAGPVEPRRVGQLRGEERVGTRPNVGVGGVDPIACTRTLT